MVCRTMFENKIRKRYSFLIPYDNKEAFNTNNCGFPGIKYLLQSMGRTRRYQIYIFFVNTNIVC